MSISSVSISWTYLIIFGWFMSIVVRPSVTLPPTLDTTDTFHTRYFSQSRDRNRGSWRDGANNRDWLSFHRCSAWPVIFSRFVRRPEDPPERWPAISSEVGQLPTLYLPTFSLSLPFSSVWKTIQSYDSCIPRTHYHHLGHVTGTISNKMRGEVVPSLRCDLLYIKIFLEFFACPTAGRQSRKKTEDCINRVATVVVKMKLRVPDYHIIENLIRRHRILLE